MSDIIPTPAEADTRSIEDRLLELTQNTRYSLISQLTKGGIPTCNKDIRVLNEVLSAADTTSLALKKLDDNNSNAHSDRQAALLAATIISNAGAVNPFQTTTVKLPANHTLAAGAIDGTSITEEEKTLGTSEVTYNEFMDKFNAD